MTVLYDLVFRYFANGVMKRHEQTHQLMTNIVEMGPMASLIAGSPGRGSDTSRSNSLVANLKNT